MEMQLGCVRLARGESFSGLIPLSQNAIHDGEVVFNTGMTGYVESLTDPSYAGQILVFTYPLIGNYGVPNSSTWESAKIHVKGVVMTHLAKHHSNYAAEQSLQSWLEQYQIPYIVDVDTRALTTLLRKHGVIAGAITPASTSVDTFETFDQIDWVKRVSIEQPIEYGSGEKLIIAVDCGMKENILRSLLAFPVRIKRVPFDYDFTNEPFDGVFLSNGPGDPVQCQTTVNIIKKAYAKKKPIFGICLGTQLMAIAGGASTYKLPFGHRAHNQPCMDLATKRCYLTSQNHSYAIDEKSLSNDWQVTFRNLNDQSIEGIEHRHLPFFSVQFHPEAAPGPMDTQWLFKKFYDLVNV